MNGQHNGWRWTLAACVMLLPALVRAMDRSVRGTAATVVRASTTFHTCGICGCTGATSRRPNSTPRPAITSRQVTAFFSRTAGM